MSWKIPLLLMSEILLLFVKTFTVNDKFSLRNIENLPQTIEMILFKKQKKFSRFITKFVKFTSNFEHFEKKDSPHSLSLFEFSNCERRG